MSSALLSSACAPVAISDRADIEAHRLFELTPLLGADACVDDKWFGPGAGEFVGHYAGRARLTLLVDSNGRIRVEAADVRNEPAEPRPVANAACLQKIQAAIADWRYRPFKRYGLRIAARLTETVALLPAERWRTPRRPFPEVHDISDVRITLVRDAFYMCERDRPERYELILHGDGRFLLTEFANVPGEGRRTERVREGRLDAIVLTDLIEQFRAADFFSLEEEYWGGWTDIPVQTLTLTIGDEVAQVRDAFGETAGMPLIVRELQEAVDRAAGLDPLRCGGPDVLLEHILAE